MALVSDASDDEMARGNYICRQCTTDPKNPVYKKDHECPFKKKLKLLTERKDVITDTRQNQTNESTLDSKHMPAPEEEEDIIKYGKVDIKPIWL